MPVYLCFRNNFELVLHEIRGGWGSTALCILCVTVYSRGLIDSLQRKSIIKSSSATRTWRGGEGWGIRVKLIQRQSVKWQHHVLLTPAVNLIHWRLSATSIRFTDGMNPDVDHHQYSCGNCLEMWRPSIVELTDWKDGMTGLIKHRVSHCTTVSSFKPSLSQLKSKLIQFSTA